MVTTLYIIKGQDAYRFGFDPVVRLWESESVSRTWIRRVNVDLPDGFEVAKNYYGDPMICCGGEGYELATNANEDPVIIDHTENGKYIPLTVLSDGWD